MNSHQLFDESAGTSDSWQYTDNGYENLSRPSGPIWDCVRATVENWYLQYPDPDNDLRERFRQSAASQHDAAWWELYIYTLFRRLGYTVEVHPALPDSTKRPDFKATRGEESLYIECAVAFDSMNAGEVDGEAWIKDCINEVSSTGFGFSIQIKAPGTRRPARANIVQQIESWVATFDNTEHAPSAISRISRTFQFADWHVTLTALPVPESLRGKVPALLMGTAQAYWGDSSVDKLRKLISKKTTQCRGAQGPLVVALLSRMGYCTSELVDQALFGCEQLRYSLNDSLHAAQLAGHCRNTDGIWHPGPPARSTRLSGVLFAEGLHPPFVASGLPSLWLNPWATYGLPQGLPFTTRTASAIGEVFTQTETVTDPRELFGLPVDWPNAH